MAFSKANQQERNRVSFEIVYY